MNTNSHRIEKVRQMLTLAHAEVRQASNATVRSQRAAYRDGILTVYAILINRDPEWVYQDLTDAESDIRY